MENLMDSFDQNQKYVYTNELPQRAKVQLFETLYYKKQTDLTIQYIFVILLM